MTALAVPASAARHSLTGSSVALRLALRRDRARLAVWTASITVMWAYASVALQSLYPTAADRQVRAALMASPAAVVLTGPGYGTQDYTHGAMVAGEMGLMVFVALAIMSIQTVVQHTRAEEESGRAELLRSGAVGRRAPFAAAVAVVLLVNVAIAVLSGAALALSGLDAGGAFALGLAGAVTGVTFGAVAAVAAQVTEHARAASGLALAALALAFVLRAAGDVQHRHGGALSWLSPLGWSQQIRAFVDLRLWPLALGLALTGGLLALAGVLGAGRDLGAGLVAARPGRARASARLSGPFALAWRLQRGAVAAWAVGVGSFALATGTFIDSVPQMAAELPQLEQLLGGPEAAADAFVALMVKFFALVVTGYCLTAASGARAEEADGHLEVVLGAAVSRQRWLLTRLAVVALAGVALLALAGAGLWAGAVGVGVTSVGLGAHLLAVAAQLPAMALLVGFAALLTGAAPRRVPLLWGWYAFAFVASVYGGLLRLPRWAVNLSPFEHVPVLPGEGAAAAELVATAVLLGAAAALVAGGVVTLGRRDVPSA